MIIKYLLNRVSGHIGIEKSKNTKFRQRYSVNQQTYLHAQSNHPKSLKDSIPYSQALHICSTICSTNSEFNKNCEIITKRFKEWSYLDNLVNEQVDKVKNLKKKQLLLNNKRTMQNLIPVSITYNRYLPNISKIITKNWNILQISRTLQKVFGKKPMITYKWNQNLGELIGGHTRWKSLEYSPSNN